ncbi:MAG TPA: lysylphosphatidylglycerol synthase domain-containing protein [Beijerinckiaceae bacterium]|nr:lysylphosphatidylglycerol synthase domain-containing protein [Beijerinckiaceae bacterium]
MQQTPDPVPEGRAAAEAAPAPVSETAAFRRRTAMQRLGALASAALFIMALVVLYLVISELDFDEVKAVFGRTSREQLLMALGLTVLSYLMLTGYDALALWQLAKGQVRYRLTALASFTSFAVSFTLGFPLITAATVRYWVYSAVGLGPGVIASLTLIAGLTFWLGMSVVLGLVMIAQPFATSVFTRLPAQVNGYVGFAILSAIFLYTVWIAARPRHIRIQGWTLHLPRLRVSLLQMLLGAVDVCAACGVLYVLLPAGHGVPFAAMVAAFVFACVLGIASHAPGGIGVFEATLLLALPGIPKEALLGSILMYRLCYYVLPFIAAIWLLGLREIWLRARRLRSEISGS